MQEPILQSNKGLDKVKTQNKQVEAALERYDHISEKLQQNLKYLQAAKQEKKQREGTKQQIA